MLPRTFYNQHAVEVAKNLLGKKLIINNQAGIITETEAYRGSDDAASHAFKPSTKRAQIMFGPPGYTYIYMIYGMYHCLNIVTEEEGQPSAVLIRGMKLDNLHLNGPGKICKYFSLNTTHNKIDVTTDSAIYLTWGMEVTQYNTTPRIGITKAQDKLWRFVLEPHR